MYVINKHIVVVLESKESRAHRVVHPRARPRYVISCTCRQKRPEDNHCIHTRAFMEDNVLPSRWRDIRAELMKAPDKPRESHNVGRA